MTLYVQLPAAEDDDDQEAIHHAVESYQNITSDETSDGTRRSFVTACGVSTEAPADRMNEADDEPGGRLCADGFFA